MLEINQALSLIIALVIGAVIGFERESHATDMKGNTEELHHSVGVRTFALASILGGIAGLMYSSHLFISLLISIVIALITISYYIVYSYSTKDLGFTTELALLLSYILAFCLGAQALPVQVVLALTVVIVLILSQKEYIRSIALDVERSEIQAFISYGLIALVVLPFLPNTSYAIADIAGIEGLLPSLGENAKKILEAEIFNPFSLWFVVVLITGIDVVGYMLEKVIGEKHGRLLTSIVGGFISSTATTQALAQESKYNKHPSRLIASALFANAVSFLPIAFLVGTINPAFMLTALPALGILFLTTTLLGSFFLKKTTAAERTKKQKKATNDTNIFSIGPAIKFAVFFLIVKTCTQIALAFFGEVGFLASTTVAGLTGIDAMTITISQLAGGSIDFSLALRAFLLLNAVNLVAKSIYSFLQGSKRFSVPFALSMLLVIVLSCTALLFV